MDGLIHFWSVIVNLCCKSHTHLLLRCCPAPAASSLCKQNSESGTKHFSSSPANELVLFNYTRLLDKKEICNVRVMFKITLILYLTISSRNDLLSCQMKPSPAWGNMRINGRFASKWLLGTLSSDAIPGFDFLHAGTGKGALNYVVAYAGNNNDVI